MHAWFLSKSAILEKFSPSLRGIVIGTRFNLKFFLILLILSTFFANSQVSKQDSLFNLLNKTNEEELTEQKIKITPQMITSVERGDLKKTVSTSGYLQPADEKALIFSLNGEIEEVLISECKRVAEGEVLIQLEKSQQELNYFLH